MFIFILGLLFNLFQPNVENNILDQLNYYLIEIQNDNNLSENTWALTELYKASCDKSNTIQRHINQSTSVLPKKIISAISCDNQFISDELLEVIHQYELYGFASVYLIKSQDLTNTDHLYESLTDSSTFNIPNEFIRLFQKINDGDTIQLSDIPEDNFDLIVNAILYHRQDEILISAPDQNQIIQRYQVDLDNLTGIKKSIQISNVAYLLFEKNRNNEFSRMHEQILHDKLFPLVYQRVRYNRALAYSHYIIGRYDFNLEINRKIIEPILEYYGLFDEADNSRVDQGVNLYSLGKFAEARDILEKLYYDPTTNVDKATLYNNLSISYQKLGEKNKYIRYLLDALEEVENNDNYSANLTILSNLYFYYSSIGDYSSALGYLESAREIATSNNDTYQIATINAITGMYYWKNENDIEKALFQLQLASKEFNPETNFFDYFRSQFSISDIYIEMDSLEQAKKVLQSISELASNSSNTGVFLESLIGLLDLALEQNNLELAVEYLNEIELYSLDNLPFKTLVKYNIQLAEYQFLSGDDRLAYQNLRPVIDQVIERARTSIDTQTGYWVQEDEYIDAFNSLLNILIATGNDYEAIQLLDEIKTINDAALYNSPILRAKRLSEEDLAKDQLLNSQITSLRESFLHANNVSERLEIKNEIDQLSAEREEILNKIRQDGVIDKSPIWLIQQSLSENEQIIHFTEVGDYLYVSYLISNTIEIHKLEFESSEKALFDSVADQIALSKTNLVDLFEIYDFLGLNEHLSTSKGSLIVIPDNYLYRIPLEILPITNPVNASSYGSTTYLIEEYQTEYFASLKEYQDLNRAFSTSFTSELAAFAISDFSDFDESYLPTLPFAAQEIRTISEKLYAFDDKNLFLEGEATKSNFLDEVVSSKVVHIATHSEVSEQDPLFSTIYLNDNNTESSVNALYAYELFERRLNNDLIMLNSCSSGSGDYLQGSGIMGITRALRYAGAKSMALNLWAVNDKVAYEFASVFYESLNAGSSKSQAMRDAKIHLLQNGNANPHYWGAFMLTGDPSPIIKRPDNAGLVLPILIVMIGSISIFIRRNKTI